MAPVYEAIARHGTFAVKHYVERALRARGEQGLPAAIEDDETLDKLALLISAADVRPVAKAIDGVSSATDRQPHIHAAGRPAPSAEDGLLEDRREAGCGSQLVGGGEPGDAGCLIPTSPACPDPSGRPENGPKGRAA